MKSKNLDKYFIVRIDRGELIIEQLKIFCRQQNINGGFFVGLGAVDELELANYDVEHKKYLSKKFSGAFELTNLTGSIGVESDLVVHAHATVGDNEMKTFSGHLVEARVSGTAEIALTPLEKLDKKLDEQTGLKLFTLK